MRRSLTISAAMRRVVFAVALLLIVYLAAVARRPSIVDTLPPGLRWFGRSGSMLSVGIVVAVLVTLCLLTFLSEGTYRAVGVSFMVVAALITMAAVLGLSAYWNVTTPTTPPSTRRW